MKFWSPRECLKMLLVLLLQGVDFSELCQMSLGFCLLQAHLGKIPLGQVEDARLYQEWQIMGREALLNMVQDTLPGSLGSAAFQWYITQPVSAVCAAVMGSSVIRSKIRSINFNQIQDHQANSKQQQGGLAGWRASSMKHCIGAYVADGKGITCAYIWQSGIFTLNPAAMGAGWCVAVTTACLGSSGILIACPTLYCCDFAGLVWHDRKTLHTSRWKLSVLRCIRRWNEKSGASRRVVTG
jgi:hypothetical protein